MGEKRDPYGCSLRQPFENFFSEQIILSVFVCCYGHVTVCYKTLHIIVKKAGRQDACVDQLIVSTAARDFCRRDSGRGTYPKESETACDFSLSI